MQHVNSGLSRMLSYIGLSPKDFNAKYKLENSLSNLTLDSRQINEHSVFLAIFGHQKSGHVFLEQVANAGCEIAFVETKKITENGLVKQERFSAGSSVICIHVYELCNNLADLAYCFYEVDNASALAQKLPSVTAITGTNGKTSVASLIAQMSSLCHQKSASIGTLGVNEYSEGQHSKLADTINTTPDIISLIATLSRLQKLGCRHVALEASSHGLEQNRLQKLKVNCAVFTNLSQDHLDYHHTMEAYAKAKRKLLDATGLKNVVLNADDDESLNWHTETTTTQNIFWYSLDALKEDRRGCWASDVTYSTQGIHFTLHAKFETYEQTVPVSVKLIGAFNVSNLLASVTALLAQQFSFSDVISSIARLSPVPGRMELFESAKASLLVDYAHTPDALKQALLATRVHTKGQLICIFGCGGDRDNSKRAMMGEIAVKYANSIVLTQDNSRSEAPSEIIKGIKKGMALQLPSQQILVELDREKAILHAWQSSHKNDMILVAGKGHEDYIEINNTRIAYNEREFVSALASRSLATEYDTHTKGSEL